MIVRPAPDGLLIDLASEADTDRLGWAIAGLAHPGLVIGLIGGLGAGKTRLVRSIAESLGVDPGAVSSPTYVLIHEYNGSIPVFHFDIYRLAGPDEFDALGAPEYWTEGGGLCLIEWADRVLDRLPPDAWIVGIEPIGPTSRRVAFRFPEGSTAATLLGGKLDGPALSG